MGIEATTAMRPESLSSLYGGGKVSTEAKSVPASSAGERSRELRRAEAHLLQEERTLTGDPKVRDASVQYEYTIGPDGKRYITGARVTYSEEGEGPASSADREEDLSSDVGRQVDIASSSAEEDLKEEAAVDELRKIDREVRAHEEAHMAAGGPYAGAVSYTYVQGPDGASYAVGGEVPISAPAGRTPEETIRIMEQVRSAAVAPGAPSAQDFRVASKASAAVAQARQELSRRGDGEDSQEDGALPLAPDEPKTPERSPDSAADSDGTRALPSERRDPDLLFSFIASEEDRDQLLEAYSAPWAMGRNNGSGAAYLGAGLVA